MNLNKGRHFITSIKPINTLKSMIYQQSSSQRSNLTAMEQ